MHAEFQNRIQEEDLFAQMPFRMASYALAVQGRYGQVRVEYRVVRLWEMDPRPFEGVEGRVDQWVNSLGIDPDLEQEEQ